MFFVYVISIVICIFWLGLGLEAVGRSSYSRTYEETIPFGLGPAALPGLAGFSVFPILNTVLAVGCIVHAVWWHRNKAS